jgi:putative MATE family efflux protein
LKQAGNPRDFTTGEVHTHLFRLTGFMLVGMISVMGASLAETIYMGRVGTTELAALGFTFPVVMIMQGITMGLSIGASSVVARLIGTGGMERARVLITHCFVLGLVLIILVASVMYLLADPFFALLGADEKIRPLSVSYIQLWLFGLPFFTVAMIGSTLMRAVGDAVTPGYLMTIGSGLQIILGPFLIFGLMGAPKMGLDGAAVAFILARTLSFLMYSYVVVFRDRLLKFSMSGFGPSCREILHVGMPAVASNLISPVAMAVFTRLLAGHGAAVVAGFSLASRIEQMFLLVIMALSMSVAPFIGQNWGAALFDRVQIALKQANVSVVGYGVVAYLVLFSTGGALLALVNDDPDVIKVGGVYLMIAPLGMGLMGVMMNSTSVFNALGKPMPALIISVLQMFVIGLPLAFLGNYLMGYAGLFASGMITALILGVVSWIWLRREIELRMVDHQAIKSVSIL